jgi:glutamate carboxypeptidase
MNTETAEAKITAWLATQEGAMLEALARMVNTDSGSYDKAGVDAVGAQIRGFCEAHGLAVETVKGARFGDCLRAVLPHAGTAPARGNHAANIVLLGHRDTVFPKGEPERRPFTIKGGRAHGPGVADMKAGLVMNMFVLAAFAKFGAAPGPLVGLFTGDEEVGSPEGRAVIEEEARASSSTPSRGAPRATWSPAARAACSWRWTSRAGRATRAHKIIAIHALTDLERGITLNVGLVHGGQSVNTVAPHAQGQIDLRYVHPEDRAEVMKRIEDIVARSFVPGTRATLTIRGEFQPLTQDAAARRLFALYRRAAAEAGLAVEGEFSGGCADSGFTAQQGAPTLCGVGPVGGLAHSPEEYLEVASLVPRAQALARAILRLDQAGL